MISKYSFLMEYFVRNNILDTTFEVTTLNIDQVSDEIVVALENLKIDRKIAVKTRLEFEAIMLNWMSVLPKGTQCRVRLNKRLDRSFITIQIAGNPVNPLVKSGDSTEVEERQFYLNLISAIDVVSSYSYRDGINSVDIHLPRKNNKTIKKMLIAIVLGVVSGLLLKMLPQPTLEFIATDVVSPTISKINGLISAVASIFIFISILSSFCSIDSISSFGNIGKKTIGTYEVVNFLTILIGSIAAVLVFGEVSGTESVTNGFLGSIYELILELIPTNLVEPFVKKDLMKISIIAIMFGAIILSLGTRVSTVRALIRDARQMMVSALAAVCRLLPVVVFLCITNLIIKNQVSEVLGSWKMLLFEAVGVWAITIIICLVAHWKKAVNYSEIKEELLSVMVIGFTTGSRTPCTQHMYDICQDNMKIDKPLADFSVSTSSIFCVYQKAISMIVLVFGMTEIFGVSVSLTDVLAMIISLNIIVYAIPPVPMGTITVISIIWTMVGVPSGAMAIAMPMDIIFGMIGTPAAVLGTISLIAIINQMVEKQD